MDGAITPEHINVWAQIFSGSINLITLVWIIKIETTLAKITAIIKLHNLDKGVL